jgi:hypothetical protein
MVIRGLYSRLTWVDIDVRTSIEIKQSTKDRLKELGKKEDTFDDIVQRLLQVYEKAGSTK